MEQTTDQNDKPDEQDSLDGQGTEAVTSNGQTPGDHDQPSSKEPSKKVPIRKRISNILGHMNIYLLLLILLLLIAGVIAFVSYRKNQESAVKVNVGTEPLSQEALDQLKQSDVLVGEPTQTLTVEANAIFSGKVLIKDDLEVAGKLKLGGPLDLSDIATSGASSFDQLQASSLQITGNGTIQGQLTVQKSLSVSGSLSVGGLLSAAQLNIQNLQVSGDLQLNRHIDAGGGTPGKVNGSALGAGGTASISGSDTAGTVRVNTGGGAGTGCFATIIFTNSFNETPHVVVTPVGSSAGSLAYYVNRSSANFSICTANTPPSGKSFAFDYIVID